MAPVVRKGPKWSKFGSRLMIDETRKVSKAPMRLRQLDLCKDQVHLLPLNKVNSCVLAEEMQTDSPCEMSTKNYFAL